MLLFGLGVIIIEALEHISHYEALLTWHFAREVFVFGVVIPLAGVILLATLDRVSARRDRLVLELGKIHELNSQMKHASNWNDLVDLIVDLPITILSAQSSALFVKKPDDSGFVIVDSQGYDEQAGPGFELDVDQCQSCMVWSLPLTNLHRCTSSQIPQAGDWEQYCMPLAYQGEVIGILVFNLLPDHTITSREFDMLVVFTSQMALLLDNARLQNLVESQTAISEAERRRIARDLHDTLGQNISYLRIKLDQMSSHSNFVSFAEIEDDLTRMRDIADEAYRQIRSTLAELHPGSQLDLETALRTQVEKVASRANFQFRFDQRGEPTPLYPHVKRHVLYICREVLNNIEKHADAQLVNVELLWTSQELTITISDDGIGIDPDSLYKSNQLGMTIMVERANEIHGVLAIDSKPGQGTRISLTIPLIASQVGQLV